MLYLMIEGTPKCQSQELLRAEELLRDADPDLYEVTVKLTCAYPNDDSPKAATTREMVVHTVRRVLGQYTAVEWVDRKVHAAALNAAGGYKAL